MQIQWSKATDDEPCLHLYCGTFYVAVAILDSDTPKELISSAKICDKPAAEKDSCYLCVRNGEGEMSIKDRFLSGLKQLLFGYCK